MDKRRTAVAEMHLDEDDILYVKILPGAVITLEEASSCFELSCEMLEGKKAMVLIDIRAEYSITEEARIFSASGKVAENRIAVAYLSRSAFKKLWFNLSLQINKPFVPAKMFSTEKRALIWLRSFYVLPGDEFVRCRKKK